MKATPLSEFLRIIDKKPSKDLSLLEYHFKFIFENCIKKEEILKNRSEVDRILKKCKEPVNKTV